MKVVRVAQLGRSQSDCSKIRVIRLSTNQIAAFANLYKQNGRMLAIFSLDQTEGRESDDVTCHVTEHVQIREKTGSEQKMRTGSES